MFSPLVFSVSCGLTASHIGVIFLFPPCVQVLCRLGKYFLQRLGGKTEKDRGIHPGVGHETDFNFG